MNYSPLAVSVWGDLPHCYRSVMKSHISLNCWRIIKQFNTNCSQIKYILALLVWIIMLLFYFFIQWTQNAFLQLNGNRILYKKYFVFLLRTNLSFLSSPFCPNVYFVVRAVCSEVTGWPFQSWLNHVVLLSSLSLPVNLLSRGRQSGRSPGSVVQLQGVLKEKLCCSNSFFCCSLDGQDVLNISVLRAWCFNKRYLSVQLCGLYLKALCV